MFIWGYVLVLGMPWLALVMMNFKSAAYIINLYQGASRVKWTTLDPCLVLSESDPKVYTNFNFYEIEIHKHLVSIYESIKPYESTKPSNLCSQKTISNNVHLL